jgi:hypothetical protein
VLRNAIDFYQDRLGTSNSLGVLVLGRSLSSVLLRRLPLHRPLLLLIEPLEHTPALALQEHAWGPVFECSPPMFVPSLSW